MTFVLAICVAVCFGVSVYLLLGRDLKSVAMGVFLLGHAANLSIIAMSGSPVLTDDETSLLKNAPIADYQTPKVDALSGMVDPLPQALILTAIVIGFAVMGFLLTLLVVTARSTGTLEVCDLAGEQVDEQTAAEAAAASDAAVPSQPGGGA
jgi:multicomponent Na+:H+ antiporter subunit C